MQLDGEFDVQPSEAGATVSSPRQKKPRAVRKVTVRLTEEVYQQLAAATDRPGVGKSMLVEAALAHFLSPPAPAEDLVQGRFDEMRERFDRLERDICVIGETVAHHARYHFAVLPPLPQVRQQEACALGDERFKVLAEQVDRRVRLGQPLMQETIGRLNVADVGRREPTINNSTASQAVGNLKRETSAAAGAGGSNSNFRHLPNSFHWPA